LVEAGSPGDAPPLPSASAPLTRLRTAGRTYRRALTVALPAWALARLLVVLSLVIAHLTLSRVRAGSPAALLRVHQGLLAWDGGWYESIARHGYAASGRQSLRFFPGLPLAARFLGRIPGLGAGPALVLIANVCALAAMATLVVLVRVDLGQPDLGRRSTWLLALAPPAYALVLGYADAPLLLCSIVTVLAARTDRWWWAAGAGLAAGLVRPVGVLLVVPVAIEVWRTRKGVAPPTRWLARVAAVAAPLAGTGTYLGWVGSQFGDPWLPFRVQQQHGHRGVITVPLASMGHNLVAVAHGHHLGSALHIPWVLLSGALLVVAFRRLPLSYAALAAAVLAVSVTSTNLDSFERYALGAFPLVIAASTLTSRRGVERAVLALAAAGMVGYAVLSFLGIVVP
jgi:hypothetical protein